MTEPLTFTVLDEQAFALPPCDAGKVPCWCHLCNGRTTGAHACDRPAERVIRPCCDAPNSAVLACTPHADEAKWNAERHHCDWCGDYGCLSVVPL